MFYTNHRVARTLTAPKLTIRIQKYKEHLYHELLQSTVRFFYAYLSTKSSRKVSAGADIPCDKAVVFCAAIKERFRIIRDRSTAGTRRID
jgi:hypothetical protein